MRTYPFLRSAEHCMGKLGQGQLYMLHEEFVRIEKDRLQGEVWAEGIPQGSTRRGRGEIVIMFTVVGHGDG